MSHWNPPTCRTADSLRDTLSNSLRRFEDDRTVSLPDLRADSEVVMASDYAGEHLDAEYQVLGFLLADRPGVLREWEAARLRVRAQYLRDARRLAFKHLADRNRQRALVPFLDAADAINGLLVCVAVEKTVELSGFSRAAEGHTMKPHVYEKLIRIAYFGSFLVGGLCRPDQNLKWITDEDEIVANDTRLVETSQVMGGLLLHHVPAWAGEFALGVAGKFDDDRRAEDLASIADLAAGAVSECLTAMGVGRTPTCTNLSVPTQGPLATKTQMILAWLSDSRNALKKLTCVVRAASDGQFRISFGVPFVRLRYPGENWPIWVPPDKVWRNTLRGH
jgi:hypothetical protein